MKDYVLARDGETLDSFCLRIFGNKNRFFDLLDANRELLNNNGIVFDAGEKVKVPKPSRSSAKTKSEKEIIVGGVFDGKNEDFSRV